MPVAWRILGGREPRAEKLDVDGCFLQKLSRLETTTYGVFCVRSNNGHTTFRNQTDVEADLWRAMQFLAAEFDKIRSGNCVFESDDWATYLATDRFPPDERLRGSLN